MRVLFTLSVYPHLPEVIGGLQTTTDDLCSALAAVGVEVAVLCGLKEHASDIPGQRAQRDDNFGYPVFGWLIQFRVWPSWSLRGNPGRRESAVPH